MWCSRRCSRIRTTHKYQSRNSNTSVLSKSRTGIDGVCSLRPNVVSGLLGPQPKTPKNEEGVAMCVCVWVYRKVYHDGAHAQCATAPNTTQRKRAEHVSRTTPKTFVLIMCMLCCLRVCACVYSEFCNTQTLAGLAFFMLINAYKIYSNVRVSPRYVLVIKLCARVRLRLGREGLSSPAGMGEVEHLRAHGCVYIFMR